LEAKATSLAEALSYGQEKLLTIAMALAKNSRLLLIDEPIAGLDLRMKDKMLSLLQKLKEVGKTVIIIEHSLDFVFRVSGRVILLHNGTKMYDGAADDIRSGSGILRDVFWGGAYAR
jgi:branched-chain amino acid transport system ATP-binding protein